MTATPTIATRARTPRWATACAVVLIVTAVIDVVVTAALWHATTAAGLPASSGEANPIQRHLLLIGGPALPLSLRLATAVAGATAIMVGARRGAGLVRPVAVATAIGMCLFVGWEIHGAPIVLAVQQQNAIAQQAINNGCASVRRLDAHLVADGRPVTVQPLCGTEAQVLSGQAADG